MIFALPCLHSKYSKSNEPSCMTSCEVETSPSVAVEHSKSKTYELRIRGLQRSFVVSSEELASRSAVATKMNGSLQLLVDLARSVP